MVFQGKYSILKIIDLLFYHRLAAPIDRLVRTFMYSQYFGLTEKPFAIAPNPRYLYMSELHREALAHLLYGINSDGCFVLLSGNVGTGKTTICRCLLEQLPQRIDIALILNPMVSTRELLKSICEELGIKNIPQPDSTKTHIDELNRYLLQSHAKGRSTALIIDEAQNLDLEVLEQLRLLTNLETNTHKLLKIILIGQPELRNRLDQPELSQLNQRITSRYHLPALEPPDVKAYIDHRITVAGGGKQRLFSDGAVKHLIKISDGIPRVINLLCDRALLGAYSENEDHVSLRIMKKAGLEVFPNHRSPALFSLKNATIAALVLLLGLSAGIFPILYDNYSNTLTGEIAVDIPASKPVADIADDGEGHANLDETVFSPPPPAEVQPPRSGKNTELTSSIVIYPDIIMESSRR